MTVYALQYDIAWENKEANQAYLEAELQRLKPEPESLVVLPELSCTGFSMRREGLAEEPGGPTQLFYQSLAQRHGIYLVGGVTWWGSAGLGRNQALVVGPTGQLLGHYAKQHPFSFGGETEHFEAGDGFFQFLWRGFRVAPLICYDLRFPESFRHLALDGVQLFVVIANWPSARVAHWDCLLVARAIENQAYVLGVNRVGADPKVTYPGSSRWIDPQGRVLSQLGEQSGVLVGELNLAEQEAYRSRFPALRDIRREQLGR